MADPIQYADAQYFGGQHGFMAFGLEPGGMIAPDTKTLPVAPTSLKAVWIWIGLCRRTRQFVAWMPGDRSSTTCWHLWGKIPPAYKKGLCYSDFWKAYQEILSKEQHRACGKSSGQTNHVERFNLTLRQRLGRLTSKTLSFSKDYLMHLVCIRYFLSLYNTEVVCKLTKSCPL